MLLNVCKLAVLHMTIYVQMLIINQFGKLALSENLMKPWN